MAEYRGWSHHSGQIRFTSCPFLVQLVKAIESIRKYVRVAIIIITRTTTTNVVWEFIIHQSHSKHLYVFMHFILIAL